MCKKIAIFFAIISLEDALNTRDFNFDVSYIRVLYKDTQIVIGTFNRLEKKCNFFGQIICVYQKFIVPLQQKNRHQNRTSNRYKIEPEIGPKIGTR